MKMGRKRRAPLLKRATHQIMRHAHYLAIVELAWDPTMNGNPLFALRRHFKPSAREAAIQWAKDRSSKADCTGEAQVYAVQGLETELICRLTKDNVSSHTSTK